MFSSAAPDVETPNTGFESDPGILENFPSGGNLSTLPLFNNTPGGTKSQLLNGGNNSQVGVGKSFAVYPGDKVKIEAYAKYESGGSSTGSGFAVALLSAFGVAPPVVGETGTVSSALNAWGSIVDGGGQAGDPTAPQAFVNIIIFDKDFNFLDAAYEQISDEAEQVGTSPDVDHDYMLKEYTIRESGFVFMYVSNNSPVNVYFDDVKITYTPTNVIQYNEYYPFGLQTSNSWTREDASNNYLYNAGSELNNNTGWYETFFRGYDPALGRFNQVDPMAYASSLTPYNYAFNDPVSYNDPFGNYPAGTIEKVNGGATPAMNSYHWGRDLRASPGSGYYWADGIGYSDWSPDGGSDMYRQGQAAHEAGADITYIGGVWQGFDANGDIQPLPQENGQLGYYVDSYTDWYQDGTYLDTQYNGRRFEPLGQQERPIPDYRFLHTDRVDMFMETISREIDSKKLIEQNIVMLEFNKSGTRVSHTAGIQRVITITESGQSIHYSKVYISSGLNANIQMMENFWRPHSLLSKYFEFILSPQDPAKGNLNISAPHDSDLQRRKSRENRDRRGSQYH